MRDLRPSGRRARSRPGAAGARECCHRLGMRHMATWLPYRLDGDALGALANEGEAPERE